MLGVITPGILRNYVKAIKLFCRMNRINMFWDIILRSLPKVKQNTNDRIPIVQQIKKQIIKLQFLYYQMSFLACFKMDIDVFIK
jgi:hypothetical protein